ncbi:MAG: hypothetical protein J6A60_04945 [Clostridia bacterium]|nr:hypothetical protein [Clostridia bacterium]
MKKILSVILSLLIVCGVFSVNAFAAVETATDAPSPMITGIDLTIDFNIGGKKVDDYKNYITINTAGLEFEESDETSAVLASRLYSQTTDENYFEGEIYGMGIYLTTADGYYFPIGEEVTATVNGTEVLCETGTYFADEETEIPYAYILVTAIIGKNGKIVEGKTDKLIREISIDVEPVAGMTVGEWKDFVTLNTDNIRFNDIEGLKGVYVYNADYVSLPDYYVFVAGEEYIIEVEVVADAGYCFPFAGLDKLIINGEESEDYSIYTYTEDGVEFIEFVAAVTVSVPEGENSVFDHIINFFAEIAANIQLYSSLLLLIFALLFGV